MGRLSAARQAAFYKEARFIRAHGRSASSSPEDDARGRVRDDRSTAADPPAVLLDYSIEWPPEDTDWSLQ
eukprot:7568270-Heterocapsa_arctica.AAC.1